MPIMRLAALSPREALVQWALRRSPPARGAIVLDRRRIYILPTRFGTLYLAVCLLMLLAAMHYSNSMIFLLTFLLIGLFTNGMWQTHGQLLGLRIASHGARPVHAGQTLHLQLELSNDSTQPRPALQLAARDQPAVSVDLPASSTLQASVPIRTRQRGLLTIDRLRISSRFPLGLFEAWSWFRFDQRLLVYPAPILRPLPGQGQGGRDGRSSPDTVAGDEDFDRLRAYHPGDPASRIAWKRSAADGGLLSKQFEQPRRRTLWLDWDAAPATDPEQKLSILAGWVIQADRAGLRYGLRLPGKTLPPGTGTRHRHLCLEALALYGHAN
ncbi:MAG: DUF58 domain-containing protein [Gammaproteobacteria bacterium]|nr:MAG: DUF58 domain-containing protein [Gammaproteobacteria bacterium]